MIVFRSGGRGFPTGNALEKNKGDPTQLPALNRPRCFEAKFVIASLAVSQVTAGARVSHRRLNVRHGVL